MEKNIKSKIIVIGFIVFVLSVYTGSYFYTKSNNERLLSSPRIVLLLGSEDEENQKFSDLTSEQRRDAIRLLQFQDKVFFISQTQFDAGNTDILAFYADEDIGENYSVADCLDYSEQLERTMIKVDRNALEASWIFAACGLNP